jgi:RNA polymerase sigma factor (sigma-70 family)
MTLPPFQTLIDEHARAVAAYLRGMIGPDLAEDALQETYLAALRAYPGFDGRSPRAWLLTIARNKAIDEARAGARRPGPLEEPDGIARNGGDPAGELPSEGLRSAVAALPPKQREAVLLRFGADLAYRDVGAAMGCSEAAARRSVHEGIAKLRNSTTIREEARA